MTKPREKTREELTAEIEDSKKKIGQKQVYALGRAVGQRQPVQAL